MDKWLQRSTCLSTEREAWAVRSASDRRNTSMMTVLQPSGAPRTGDRCVCLTWRALRSDGGGCV